MPEVDPRADIFIFTCEGLLLYLIIHLSLRDGPALAMSSYSIVYRIIDMNNRLLWPALGWDTHRNHFFRTEAIDLLKTHDRAPGPNPTRTHVPNSPRRKAKGAAFRKMDQVVWSMSRCSLMRTAPLFPRARKRNVVTLVKQRMSCISGSEHLTELARSSRQSALPALW